MLVFHLHFRVFIFCAERGSDFLISFCCCCFVPPGLREHHILLLTPHSSQRDHNNQDSDIRPSRSANLGSEVHVNEDFINVMPNIMTDGTRLANQHEQTSHSLLPFDLRQLRIFSSCRRRTNYCRGLIEPLTEIQQQHSEISCAKVQHRPTEKLLASNWNHLDDTTVHAPAVEHFKTQ